MLPNYTVSQKTSNCLIGCNFLIHSQILLTFGMVRLSVSDFVYVYFSDHTCTYVSTKKIPTLDNGCSVLAKLDGSAKSRVVTASVGNDQESTETFAICLRCRQIYLQPYLETPCILVSIVTLS